MIINAGGLLNEKQAKELKTSLTNMLKDFSQTLSSSLTAKKANAQYWLLYLPAIT